MQWLSCPWLLRDICQISHKSQGQESHCMLWGFHNEKSYLCHFFTIFHARTFCPKQIVHQEKIFVFVDIKWNSNACWKPYITKFSIFKKLHIVFLWHWSLIYYIEFVIYQVARLLWGLIRTFVRDLVNTNRPPAGNIWIILVDIYRRFHWKARVKYISASL